MKLQGHNNSLKTNVEGEKQEFGIGDASVVIEILRNRLYEHKIQTLVQEYICNARDSHRELGKTDCNFEITIPTYLSPTFKVRDFGPGISVERMRDVFILYGASTKRGTNNQTGGFGIGAKSSFCYTDSFTIVTVIDGVKRSYVAHVGANNNGRLDLLSTEKTDEKNGTEIQVAVNGSDITEFRDAVFRAIYFWDDKPTLKGGYGTPTLVKGYKIGTTVEIIKPAILPHYTGVDTDQPLIIIDGVPYDVSRKLLDKCKTLDKLSEFVREKIIFNIGNGILEVSASRESIADSPRSIENIEKMAHKAALEIKTHISDAFGAVKGPKEYIETYRTLNKAFHVEAGFAKYGAYQIQNDKIMGGDLQKIKMTEIHCRGRYGRGKVNKITKREIAHNDRKQLPLELFEHIFFFKGHESDLVKNKRIRQYFSGTNVEILLLEAQPAVNTTTTVNGVNELDTVVKDFGIKNFTDIALPPVVKEERIKVSREKTQFCMHVLNRNRFHYTNLTDNKDQWLYVPIGKDEGWGYDLEDLKELNSYIGEQHKVHICGLAERSLKMVQGNSKFKPLKDWLDNFTPSKAELNQCKRAKRKNEKLINKIVDVKDIDDPELVDIIKEYKQICLTKLEIVPAILFKKVEKEQEVKDFEAKDENIGKLFAKKYGLLEIVENYHYLKAQVQELAVYLNAKFNK